MYKIRDDAHMTSSHGDRIEQIVLCLLDAQALVLHTLAHRHQPDMARLKSANDRIVDLIQKLYHNNTHEMLQ